MNTPGGAPPTGPVPAVPPRFHLRMRVLTAREDEALAAGQSLGRRPHFAGKAYELQWGADTFEGMVDDDGYVDREDLDGSIATGSLRLGDRSSGRLDSAFDIPIRRVHAADVSTSRGLIHEISWRLVNLGFLDAHPAPEADVTDALVRFLYRRLVLVPGEPTDPFALLRSGVGTAPAAELALYLALVQEASDT